MKLISFGPAGAEQPGLLVADDRYVPLAPFLARYGVVGDMNAVLGLLPVLRDELAGYAAVAAVASLPLSDTRLGPPVTRPRSIIAVGANTHSHVKEASRHTGGYVSKIPMLITKAVSSLCGPNDPIRRPPESRKLDYETELAVVIGKAASNVSPENALDHVAGYMACSDVTARDVQTGEGEDVDFYWQHFRGKSFETFLPTGPWILTADELPDLGEVKLQTYVNDKVRQNSDLSDLVFDIPSIIASVSSCVPLLPGDILVTGSPEGVGHFMDPPGYLEPGDVLRTVIPPVGELSNKVVVS
ncbi:fumarylacetoacetate hydrolase family protein [Micromonospora sp. NPDC005299]|uniref:fumarylacetoacetate hydrolase family protein n=1 Tax=Micromonospora sp. NPDC005299 TaxID=3364231 RepID=UPI0036C95018